MKRISILIWVLVVLLAFPTITVAAAELNQLKQITGVRWYNHGDDINAAAQLRLVIDEEGPVTYNTFVLINPTRLVLDLNGTWIHSSLPQTYAIENDMVRQVRISQNQPNIVRIVLDIKEGMQADEYRISTIKEDPTNGNPWRLVLDFGQLKPVPDNLTDANSSKPVVNAPATQPALPPTAFPDPKPIKFYDAPGLQDKVIVLDPGHGGSDSGAIGAGKTTEKNLALTISQEVRKLLEKSGAKVVMTRTEDRDVYQPNATAAQELQARADIANKAGANLFVSVHINSFTSPDANGTAIYYYPKTTGDIRLARFVHDGMIQQMGLFDRGNIPARFYVLKHTDMPAVLAEVAFVSNPAEEKLLNDPNFRKKAALGIYNGIAKYFTPAE
jgi:N-acetylmuramoyl-L-alanine amidase